MTAFPLQKRSLAEYNKDKPRVNEIDPEVVKRLYERIKSARGDKLPSNGPIDDIQKYDWVNDPNGYCDERGLPPPDRCYHCGYRYANATGFSAFCNICLKAMKYMEGGVLTQREQLRIRIPDGKSSGVTYI